MPVRAGPDADGRGLSRPLPRPPRADSRVISLIYEEFCLREEREASPDVEAFCDRYPAWKDSLASQLQYHRLFSQAAGCVRPVPAFPSRETISRNSSWSP